MNNPERERIENLSESPKTYNEILTEPELIKANAIKRRLGLLFADETGVVDKTYRGMIWQRHDDNGDRAGPAELFLSHNRGFANLAVTGSDEYGFKARLDDFSLVGDSNITVLPGDSLTFFATDQLFESDDSTERMIDTAIDLREKQLEQRRDKVSQGLGRLFRR